MERDPIRIEIRIERATLRRALVASAAVCALTAGGLALAVPVPHQTFTPNQQLKAEHLQQNFQNIETRLAALEATERSSVVLDTDSGAGSANTKVRNFTNVVKSGTALTATTSATNGAAVTVNEAGIYEVCWGYARWTANAGNQITINSTTDLNLPSTSVLAVWDSNANEQSPAPGCSGAVFLPANAVIRAVTNLPSLVASNAAYSTLRVTKVAR